MKGVFSAIDTKLVIQIVSLVGGLVFVSATSNANMTNHLDFGGIHMNYREMASEFVPREIFNTKMRSIERQLTRIENMLKEKQP